MNCAEYPKLWKQKSVGSNVDDIKGQSNIIFDGSEESFIRARRDYHREVISKWSSSPPRKSLLSITRSSFFAGEELAISCILLSLNHLFRQNTNKENNISKLAWLSHYLFVATGFIVYFISHRKGISIWKNCSNSHRQMLAFFDTPVFLRASALIFVAGAMICSSSIFRGTALLRSSKDFAHVLLLLRSLGVRKDENISVTKKSSNASNRSVLLYVKEEFILSKASFLSITFLASTLSLYENRVMFVISSLIIFDILPTMSHLLKDKISSSTTSSICVTGLHSLIAVYLLPTKIERRIFILLFSVLCFIVPILRWWMQGYKKVISGPWDIAHVTVNEVIETSITK